MAANKTYSFFGKMRLDFDVIMMRHLGMQVESKSLIKCVLYRLKFSNFLLYNTSLMTYFNWNGRQTLNLENFKKQKEFKFL